MQTDRGTTGAVPAKQPSPSYAKQLTWSLIAAAVIVLLVVVGVTAKIGPGLDATELRERQELIEERQERREEQQEEREEQAEENDSGPG
jgi:hypothetical protein